MPEAEPPAPVPADGGRARRRKRTDRSKPRKRRRSRGSAAAVTDGSYEQPDQSAEEVESALPIEPEAASAVLDDWVETLDQRPTGAQNLSGTEGDERAVSSGWEAEQATEVPASLDPSYGAAADLGDSAPSLVEPDTAPGSADGSDHAEHDAGPPDAGAFSGLLSGDAPGRASGRKRRDRSKPRKQRRSKKPDWMIESEPDDGDELEVAEAVTASGDEAQASHSKAKRPKEQKRKKGKERAKAARRRGLTGIAGVVDGTAVTIVSFADGAVASIQELDPAKDSAAAIADASRKVKASGRVVVACPVAAVSTGGVTEADADNARDMAEAQFCADRFGPTAPSLVAGRVALSPQKPETLVAGRRFPDGRITLAAACVPASEIRDLIWVRIGHNALDLGVVVDHVLEDWVSIPSHGVAALDTMLHAADTSREEVLDQWATAIAHQVATAIPEWGTRLVRPPMLLMDGPALTNRQAAGLLLRRIREQTNLPVREAPPGDVGIVDAGEAAAAPAAHAVLAALALSAPTLRRPVLVLNAARRRARRTLVAVVVSWMCVYSAMLAFSIWTGNTLTAATKVEDERAAAAEADIAEWGDTNSGAAREGRDRIIDRSTHLDVGSPDWEAYLRWAEATDHALGLDRSGQANASIVIEATSLPDAIRQQREAVGWLDCFAKRVFSAIGYARTAAGLPLEAPLPVTDGRAGYIAKLELGAEFGINDSDGMSGVDVAGLLGVVTLAPVTEPSADAGLDGSGAQEIQPAVVAPERDEDRDCGPPPETIQGETDDPPADPDQDEPPAGAPEALDAADADAPESFIPETAPDPFPGDEVQ